MSEREHRNPLTTELSWRLGQNGPDVVVPTMFRRRHWRVCGAYWTPYSCTRPAGHTGRHASYGVRLVVAVWP